MIVNEWINKDGNIKDFINEDWIGKVCIVLEWIGIQNIGHKILDRSLMERIKLNWKGHVWEWLDCKGSNWEKNRLFWR